MAGEVRLDVDGTIATITNDNPGKHNAFDDEMDVRKAIRMGGGIEAVAAILRRAVELKPTGHHLLEGRSTRDRSMYQIGG